MLRTMNENCGMNEGRIFLTDLGIVLEVLLSFHGFPPPPTCSLCLLANRRSQTTSKIFQKISPLKWKGFGILCMSILLKVHLAGVCFQIRALKKWFKSRLPPPPCRPPNCPFSFSDIKHQCGGYTVPQTSLPKLENSLEIMLCWAWVTESSINDSLRSSACNMLCFPSCTYYLGIGERQDPVLKRAQTPKSDGLTLKSLHVQTFSGSVSLIGR